MAAEQGEGGAVVERDFYGLRYSDLELSAAARLLQERPTEAPFAYIVTPNAQHIVRLWQGDHDFALGYASAWLRLIDSRVLQILAQLLFGRRLPLARGSDLTAALLAAPDTAASAIAVIGGDEALAEALRVRFDLQRLVLHRPPMGLLRDEPAQQACVDFALAQQARYLFLAVGAPQSERIAARIAAAGGAAGVGLCIGSSLHFASGLVPRAPRWMRWAGLEWLHRLVIAPRRHARRIFVESLPLLWLLLQTRLTGRRLIEAEPARRQGA